MPSPLRPPKALPEWIELDYYRRPRLLRVLRGRIGWVVLLAGSAAIGLLMLWGKWTVFQAGPVSTAHCMFNNDCGRCHTEPFQPARRLWFGNAELRSVADAACLQCHDGPLHNDQQARDVSCSSCHQEHRGRPLLARVDDSHCTACHAQLTRKDGQPCDFLNVTDFASGHPEFQLWRDEKPTDPGRVNFNHHVHLKEQGVLGPDNKPVKLDCAACHQPDAERRYMLPVNYERHCASCHPLLVQVGGDWKDAAIARAAEQFRRTPAPHRRPAEVRAAMRERYTQFVEKFPAVLDADQAAEVERPIPGRRRPPPWEKAEGPAWVDYQLRAVERILFRGAGGCAYCHEPKSAAPPEIGALPEYLPTALKQRWFEHGLFDHDSHRNLRCAECHPSAGSRRTGDVLMPRVATCQACHNPRVGVRSECVDCHRYHDRRREKRWKGTLTISDALDDAAPTPEAPEKPGGQPAPDP
jgi:hypothetical protein